MEFLKRSILWLGGIAVVGIIVLTTGVNYLAERNAVSALQRASSMQAELRSVRLGLFSGARLNALSLHEKEDNDTPMWRAELVQLDAPPEAFSLKQITANSLRIEGLQLFLERRDRTDANYITLIQDWPKLLQELPEPPEQSEQARHYQIDEVTISGLNIRAIDHATQRGPTDVNIKTEEISFAELGFGRKGLTLPELTATVLYGVLHHVAHRERELPPELSRDMRLLLRKLPEPDAKLPSRPSTLGEQAADTGQEFFDKAMQAIDKFMDGEEPPPGPAEEPEAEED